MNFDRASLSSHVYELVATVKTSAWCRIGLSPAFGPFSIFPPPSSGVLEERWGGEVRFMGFDMSDFHETSVEK